MLKPPLEWDEHAFTHTHTRTHAHTDRHAIKQTQVWLNFCEVKFFGFVRKTFLLHPEEEKEEDKTKQACFEISKLSLPPPPPPQKILTFVCLFLFGF